MAKSKRNQLEHREQCEIFNYISRYVAIYPRLRLLHSSFNPGKMSIGASMKMKREGAKAGFPDLCFPVASSNYHTLWIEMKVGYNQLSPAQEEMSLALLMEGHQVLVCRTWQEAVKNIFDYLGNIDPRHYPDGGNL